MTLGGSAIEVMHKITLCDSQGIVFIEDKLLTEILLKCIIC